MREAVTSALFDLRKRIDNIVDGALLLGKLLVDCAKVVRQGLTKSTQGFVLRLEETCQVLLDRLAEIGEAHPPATGGEPRLAAALNPLAADFVSR